MFRWWSFHHYITKSHALSGRMTPSLLFFVDDFFLWLNTLFPLTSLRWKAFFSYRSTFFPSFERLTTNFTSSCFYLITVWESICHLYSNLWRNTSRSKITTNIFMNNESHVRMEYIESRFEGCTLVYNIC